MDFRDLWLGMPKQDRQSLADKLGTSYKYLQKIAGGFGLPSLELAQAIKDELPTVDVAGFIRAKQRAGRRASAS